MFVLDTCNVCCSKKNTMHTYGTVHTQAVTHTYTRTMLIVHAQAVIHQPIAHCLSDNTPVFIMVYMISGARVKQPHQHKHPFKAFMDRRTNTHTHEYTHTHTHTHYFNCNIAPPRGHVEGILRKQNHSE